MLACPEGNPILPPPRFTHPETPFSNANRRGYNVRECLRSSAAEHFFGKEEVTGSILVEGSSV